MNMGNKGFISILLAIKRWWKYGRVVIRFSHHGTQKYAADILTHWSLVMWNGVKGVNMDSHNGLVPDNSQQLPEPIVTYNQ